MNGGRRILERARRSGPGRWLAAVARLARLRAQVSGHAAELQQSSGQIETLRGQVEALEATCRRLDTLLGDGPDSLRQAVAPDLLAEIEALHQRVDQWRADRETMPGRTAELAGLHDQRARELLAAAEYPGAPAGPDATAGAGTAGAACLGLPGPAERAFYSPGRVLVGALDSLAGAAGPDDDTPVEWVAAAELPAGTRLFVTLEFLRCPPDEQLSALASLGHGAAEALWMPTPLEVALDGMWAGQVPGGGFADAARWCGWAREHAPPDGWVVYTRTGSGGGP